MPDLRQSVLNVGIGCTSPPRWRRFIGRLPTPLLLVLLVAAITGDALSFGIVAAVITASVDPDLVQAQRAGRTTEFLQQAVALRVRVRRDGQAVERPVRELVPGDVVELAAGSLVPAAARYCRPPTFSSTRRCSPARLSR